LHPPVYFEAFYARRSHKPNRIKHLTPFKGRTPAGATIKSDFHFAPLSFGAKTNPAQGINLHRLLWKSPQMLSGIIKVGGHKARFWSQWRVFNRRTHGWVFGRWHFHGARNNAIMPVIGRVCASVPLFAPQQRQWHTYTRTRVY
jgi:hypothetical protein